MNVLKKLFMRKADINLQPGELYIIPPNSKKVCIKTILGSCISIIFYHPPTRTSAVSHALLPNSNTKEICGCCVLKCKREKPNCKFKYVTTVISHMLFQFEYLGIKKTEIVVKLFGGAKTIDSDIDIGSMNLERTYELLDKENLKITNEDTGGLSGRTIYFCSATGRVIVKKIKKIV